MNDFIFVCELCELLTAKGTCVAGLGKGGVTLDHRRMHRMQKV